MSWLTPAAHRRIDNALQREFELQRANGASLEDAWDFVLKVKQQKEAHSRPQAAVSTPNAITEAGRVRTPSRPASPFCPEAA